MNPNEYDRYKDETGVIDLAALRRGAERRAHGRVMGVLAVAAAAVAIIGGPWLALTGFPREGLQGALLGIGLAWATGCMWADDTHSGTTFGRRSRVLMPLGAIPCVLVALVPMALGS